jgi:hypothetical protein
MFNCSGRHNGKRGNITVNDGLIAFSDKIPKSDVANFNIGGVSIPSSINEPVNPSSTYTLGGKTYTTGNDGNEPSELSIPVEAIFEMRVEGVDPNGQEIAVGVALTAAFAPAGLAFLSSRKNTNKLILLVDNSVTPGDSRHEFQTSDIQGLCDAIKTEIFMVNKRSSLQDGEDRVFIKETVREIVKIPCEYCGTLNEITKQNCQKCGAPIK